MLEPSYITNNLRLVASLLASSQLSSLKKAGRFPNLERVTVNGFSAGAQLASRWSIFSPYANNDAGLELDLTVRTVVADGSSYVYLDETRPVDYCTTLEDTGTNHSCDSYEIPLSADTCSSYNGWKYGLDFTNLTANVYLEVRLNAERSDEITTRSQVAKTPRTYISVQDAPPPYLPL